jgi:hypothetical protein
MITPMASHWCRAMAARSMKRDSNTVTALASVLSTTTIATRPVDWPIVRAT